MDHLWIIALLFFFLLKNAYLALKKRIRSMYIWYGITAELPFNRAKVLILGDEGAGKTSTRKRLCGEGFSKIMPRTEGIEITNVTYNWKRVRISDDDFEKIASYVTIKEHFDSKEKEFVQIPLCYRILYYVLINVSIIVLEQSAIKVSPITCMLLHFALPIAELYSYACNVSGGISVCRMLTHLLIAFFASMVEDERTFYGPLVEQVTFNVVILLLYDGIFVSIAVHMFGFYRGILLEMFIMIIKGILLGIVLMIHQVRHKLPVPINEFSQEYEHFIVMMRLWVSLIFLLIECLFRRFLRYYFSNMAHTIYLMVFMIVIIVIKCDIVVLSLELTIVLLHNLYIYSWLNTHVIQLNSLGRPSIFFLWMLGLNILLGLGILLGIFFFWICTIDPKVKILEVIFSVIVFVAIEIYLWMEGETDIPMSHLNNAAAAYRFGDCPPDKRWIICDFAGQQIYYDTHHIFIPRQGVFLVVFDASEFIVNGIENSRGLVERVEFWVQSVAVHADKENSVVFVIGTHKNILKDNQLTVLSKVLEDKLYSQYSRLLKFNRSMKRMVFFIENEDEADQERASLRIAIAEEAGQLPFVNKKWPIRYHLFQRIISSKRKLNEYVIKKSSLREEIVKQFKLAERKREVKAVKQREAIDGEMKKQQSNAEKLTHEGKHGKSEENIGEKNRIEVNSILEFFNRSGDIFYEPIESDYDEDVIIDLQILVDVVRMLVYIPLRHERERAFAEQWHVLEEKGIVERTFLTYIFHQHNIEDKHTDMMIDVLVRKEILFACGEHKFRLLCKLPKCEVSEIEPTGKSVIFYATFKVFRAEYVFLHLLPRLGSIQHDRIFYNAAEFKESSKCRYVIRVRKACEEGPRFKIFESDVLKILIKCEDSFDTLDVAFKIKADIEQILFSTRGTRENENLLDFGHLCMDCGTLLVISLDLGKEVRKIVPDIFHTIEVTEEKIIATCSALMKEKQD